VLLSVICEADKIQKRETVLFRETGTFGVRRHTAERSKLQREAITVETPWGSVKAKLGWRADGFEVLTPEYEDCARIARNYGVPLREVYAAVRK
jgi:pyridinium-3,5-bisthiocarboxylic acid mononucleotide nickel chelatase